MVEDADTAPFAPDVTPELLAVLGRPMSSPNVFEETVERLGAAIKMRLVRPGGRLPTERDLAEIMGTSRTTIREAIRVLAAGDFLDVRRGRNGGTFVSQQPPSWPELSADDLQRRYAKELPDFLDYRRVIETGCVELAAERASERQVEELRRMVEAMPETEKEFHLYRQADTAFHLKLAEISNSRRLADAMAEVQTKAAEVMTAIPFLPEACRHSTEQHMQIVRAIGVRDAGRARQIMLEHIDATSRFLRGLLP